jgi:hypothetical protein
VIGWELGNLGSFPARQRDFSLNEDPDGFAAHPAYYPK